MPRPKSALTVALTAWQSLSPEARAALLKTLRSTCVDDMRALAAAIRVLEVA